MMSVVSPGEGGVGGCCKFDLRCYSKTCASILRAAMESNMTLIGH